MKRLAASFTIAARNNGFRKADARAATRASVNAYRTAMIEFAAMRTMDIWYDRVSEQDVMPRDRHRRRVVEAAGKKKRSEGCEEGGREDRREGASRDSLQALSKLAEHVDGQYRIVSQPPIVVPLRDLAERIGVPADQIEQLIHEQFRAYRETLQDDRRHLLERFEFVDVARKVVGVGSVGTGAFIVLAPGTRSAGPAVPPGQGSDDSRCSRITCRRAGTRRPASAWCRGSG